MTDQSAIPPAGWHPDPYGRHEHRYWNGSQWTDQVADGGQVSTDQAMQAAPAAPAGTQSTGSAGPKWALIIPILLAVVALAVVITLVIVGDDGDNLDTAAAAEAAQSAIDEGDLLGDCPFGPTQDLVDALPNDLPLVDGFEEVSDNDGQVFSGGQVDITYCPVNPSDFAEGPIDEFRVDVSPGADIDVNQYLDEEWSGAEDADVTAADGFAGGDVSEACWPGFTGFRQCGVFWQSDDLFVAVVPSGEADIEPDDTVAMAEAMVPLVVERLARAGG